MTRARTARPSRARAEVLGPKLERVPVTTRLPILPDVVTPEPIVPTLDDLAAEARPVVFRLLDAGKPYAAAEVVATYAVEADRALWREVLPTGSLAVSRW